MCVYRNTCVTLVWGEPFIGDENRLLLHSPGRNVKQMIKTGQRQYHQLSSHILHLACCTSLWYLICL